MPSKDSATIQGTADSELTPETILEIGKTLGMQYKYVTIGMNMHPSSMMVFSSLVAGLTSAGASVRNAGILPSPAIPFATENTDCCVMIGNPDDSDRVSGLSFMNTDGRYFNGPQMFTFRNRLDKDKSLPDYTQVGSARVYNGAIDKYCKKISDFVGVSDCQVVIDCASDSPATAVPVIMKRIGADAMTVSCQSDLKPHGTWANPEEYNIRTLAKIVRANYGSIGIALNNDGTRVAAIDEKGEPINGDILMQLFIKFLQPRKIVVPIDTTMAIGQEMKGMVTMCKLGSESLGETVKSANADMGMASDGTFIFKTNSFACDGIAAAAMLTRMATETSLRDLIMGMPKYCREEVTVKYPANREIIAKKIAARVSELEYKGLSATDGWRVEMESGWFLIRFSDFENEIEIKVEGTEKIYTAGLMEIAKEIVSQSIRASQ